LKLPPALIIAALPLETLITLRASEAAVQCIVIGPVCGFVCGCVCVFVGLLPR